jgi:hypothetical protein
MGKKFFIILAISLALALTWAPPEAGAVDQGKMVGRAQVITSAWDNALYEGLKLLCHSGSGPTWYLRHLSLHGKVVFDIKPEKSGSCPYVMAVIFAANIKDNASSPQANGEYSQIAKRAFFFKTPEEARKHITPPDLRDFGVRQFTMHYAYCQEQWRFRGGSKLFNDFILKDAQHVSQNAEFWKKAKIPTKK